MDPIGKMSIPTLMIYEYVGRMSHGKLRIVDKSISIAEKESIEMFKFIHVYTPQGDMEKFRFKLVVIRLKSDHNTTRE